MFAYIYTFPDYFPYRLLQNIEYSSLCCTVYPCWLSVLYVYVYVNPKLLIYHPARILYPLVIISLFLCLWVCFCFVNKLTCIFFLDSSYKWYHMIFVFPSLAYFTYCDHLKVHPCCCEWHYSFLWLSSIPLCVYVCVCV